jgi:hypothetical protein
MSASTWTAFHLEMPETADEEITVAPMRGNASSIQQARTGEDECAGYKLTQRGERGLDSISNE